MRRKQSRDIGLHAPLHLGVQRQTPIVEQVIVDSGGTMFGRARVANQQDLSPLFQAFELAFLIAVIHSRHVPAAEAVSLTVQPGRSVLRTQPRQAVTKESGGQALEQRHLGQRT